MTVTDWVEENLEYGRKLVSSGVEGAQAGGEAALGDETLPEVLLDSAPSTLGIAVTGAGLGLLCSYFANKRKVTAQAALFAAVGAFAGFVIGAGWSTRHVAKGMRVGAMHNIKGVRDERWLERHPIDYA